MRVTPFAVGVDIAKQVFQIHEVDPVSGEIRRLPLKRARFLERFANHVTGVIGMEKCGGAHHRARQLSLMDHTVKLLPAQKVRPFAVGNKNDIADAPAIWMAMQHPAGNNSQTTTVTLESQLTPVAVYAAEQIYGKASHCRSPIGEIARRPGVCELRSKNFHA